MTGLFLVAVIDGRRVAFAADNVDSVVKIMHVTAAPLAPSHVLGLAALRSRVITLIDARTALGLPVADHVDALTTIVVNLDGHQYGLVVDRVDDVTVIAGARDPVRGRLGQGWAAAALGILDHNGALLLLSPAALIAGPQKAAA